jgi:hypothetical protein
VRVRLTVLCFITFVLFINTAPAQSPNGTVSGIVLDPSGGVIVGADVLIINNATGVQYPGKANSEGYYVVSNVPPGTYRIQVSNSGFKTIIKPDIVMHVQDALAINFALPIGASSEIVTVTGGAPLVNTENAAVGTVIDRNFVGNLPLNGRTFNTLLQLTPGVVIAPNASGASGQGQFSIAGQRTDANSFTVDGVSANFGVGSGTNSGETGMGGSQAFSATGGTASLVSVDALQEFRIQTSSFSPEFGKTPGGQVILSTRSGTNEFHGGAFDYFRNTVMDSNDWFANAAGNPRAPEHHNDFGGILGGPIWKNKTFFFFSYEGARLDLPGTLVNEVPSEYARTNAPPQLTPFLNAYPKPNDRTVTPGVYVAQFTGTYSNGAKLDATSVRIDHVFSDHLSIFGRYNYAPSQTFQHGVGSSVSLSNIDATKVGTQTLTLGLDGLISPRTSNTLRANYSEQDNKLSSTLSSFGGAVPLNPNLLLGTLSPTQNFGYFQTFDIAALLLGNSGENRSRQANFTDSLARTEGTHQLKFGADYRSIFLDEYAAPNDLIYFTTDLPTFLSSSELTLQTRGARPSQFLAQSLSIYAQDSWKLTARLTLTYGLRWELSPAPSARGNTSLAAWQNISDPANIALAPQGTRLWKTTYGNFAPRFGFAYSLTASGDFVLRAGAGVFYDLGAGQSANLAFSFPNSAISSFPSVSAPVADVSPYLATNFSRQPPFPSGASGFDSDLKLPRSYQWNIALEKSFAGQQAISVTYVGQVGRDLLRQQAFFQPNPNFTGDFLVTGNSAHSNYNALQLQYRRPLSSRLQALLNYTLSHSLDNASNDVVIALPSNVVSAANDYASSSFDIRQSFSGAISYDIPSVTKRRALALLTDYWSLQAVIVARTGFPFNGVVFSSSPDPGGIARSRPDVVVGQPYWISNQGAPGGKVLNPAAFSVPSTHRQGTEGRNDIPGFGLTQVDLSICRKFAFTERFNLQFRADAFNVFNHPNFANPFAYVAYPPYHQSSEMLNVGLQGLTPLFQQGGPRSLQLSLKFTF